MPKSGLLDRMRHAMRVRHYSLATERAYLSWVRRFILFHGKRHPAEMGTDIRTIQKLPGHSHVNTTMIYTHVVGRGALGTVSPLDAMK